jgi:ABC-type multidrug transport system fused ATPase/permease subunit
MPSRGVLSSYRVLATPLTGRRAGVVALFVLLERLLTPLAAWLLFRPSVSQTVAASLALGAVFTARSLVQRVHVARTEAELYVRTAEATLAGDVLRTTLVPDADARAELAQGIFHTAQALSSDWPALGGDLVASGLLALVVLGTQSSFVFTVVLALTVVGLGVLMVSRRLLQSAVARAWTAQQRLHEAFLDVLDGALEIVAAGQSAAFLVRMNERATTWGTASLRLATGSLVSGRLPMLAIAGGVAAIGLMAGEHWGAHVSAASMTLLASVTPAFAGVVQGVLALAQAQKWLELVAGVVAGPRTVYGDKTKGFDLLPTTLAFESVSFRYSTDSASPRDALHEVTFTAVSPILALTGPNGSGKSTILRLLVGLGTPQSGRVTVDGIPLSDLPLETWRSRVAFLPQRPYLPPRSDIRTAIRFLAPDATDDAMLAALDRVGLLGPLSLPVDTLSVGQRQRVGLARLLCRDAAICLLDEPDANLDRAGIALVADIVRDLARAGRKVILAAHTPELVEVADHVVTLEQGGVVEGLAPASASTRAATLAQGPRSRAKA